MDLFSTLAVQSDQVAFQRLQKLSSMAGLVTFQCNEMSPSNFLWEQSKQRKAEKRSEFIEEEQWKKEEKEQLKRLEEDKRILEKEIMILMARVKELEMMLLTKKNKERMILLAKEHEEKRNRQKEYWLYVNQYVSRQRPESSEEKMILSEKEQEELWQDVYQFVTRQRPVYEKFLVVVLVVASVRKQRKQREYQEVTEQCQLCIHKHKAVNWCGTCEKNICRSCKLYHEKVWLVMDHDIRPLHKEE